MKPVLELLRKLHGAAVLCVGDIMVDNFIYGDATRLSPEAPIPVVRVRKTVSMPGGMGNVVRNLGEVGVLPLAVSVAGNDANAHKLSELFMHSGWLPPIMILDPDRPTIVKNRVIAGRQQVVRFDEEESGPISQELEDKLLEAVRRHVGGVKAVAVSDYGKGIVSARVVAETVRLAKGLGVPVVVDPKGSDYSKYRGATMVTPNRKELMEAVGRDLAGEDEIVKAGAGLIEEFGIDSLLVTRSEEGMTLLTRRENGVDAVSFPALAREVSDVSGAGDTVVAMMTAALGVSNDGVMGAKLATLAAGVVVGKVGTAVARPEEIEEEAARWDYKFPGS